MSKIKIISCPFEVKYEQIIENNNNLIIAKDLYKITEAYEIIYEYKGKQKSLYIEKDFTCDLASIPRFFQSIFPKTSFPFSTASIPHDKGYRKDDLIITSQEEVDLLFEAILKFCSFDNYVFPKFIKDRLYLDIYKVWIFKLVKKITKKTNSQIFHFIVSRFGKKYYKSI